MTDQPNETETPHGETVTHLGGYQLPYWDEDNGWPGTPFPGRWVPATKTITGAVNAAAAFLDNGTVGTLRVWVGKTDTETGETWRVWGLTDRPVSATLYRDKDDQVGIHAVFIPAKPARDAGATDGGRAPGQVAATVQILTGEQARTELPDLFTEDPDVEDPDDGRYFNELPAHGNANWVDYWPSLVLVVRNPDGQVVTAENASRWHLEALGYGQHLPAEEEAR